MPHTIETTGDPVPDIPVTGERFAAMLRAATDYSVVGTDLDGIITVFSGGAERMLGYHADELVGNATPLRFHDPAELATRAVELGVAPGFEVFVAAARAGGAETRTWTYVRKDGSRLTVSLSVAAMHDERGNLCGFVGIAHDTTEQRRAEAALARLAHQQELVLNSAGEGIFGLAPAGTITFINPAAARLLGYEVDELVGCYEHAAVHHSAPDGSPYPMDACAMHASLVDGGVHRVAGEIFWTKDGTSVPVEYVSTPMRERGQIVGAVVVFRDISQRKRSDEALRRQAAELHEQAKLTEAAEAKFRTFVESAPDAIVVVDTHGRINLVNRQTERIFGYDRQELVGEPVEKLIPERFRARHIDHRRRYAADPHTRPMGAGLALFGRRKDGSEFPTEISLSPVHVDGQTLITSVIRDITEQKAAAERLRQTAAELARSNAELQQFAYVASHDLQEPLRMVASYTQLLARRYSGKLGPDADDFIAFAVDGARRMQGLIDDLLTYSRVGTRGRPFEPTDCADLYEQVVVDLAPAIRESGALLTRGELPIVLADPLQLGQVLQNLLGNAIKFHGDERPRVHVAAERQDDAWLFSVRDHGIGIAPEYAGRIFVIFQRLHSRAEYPGTGIGLAICKKIVEHHSGRIWFKSQPGQGSTFFFTLPAYEMRTL